MAANDFIRREVLPIPDRKPISLTTYGAEERFQLAMARQ